MEAERAAWVAARLLMGIIQVSNGAGQRSAEERKGSDV